MCLESGPDDVDVPEEQEVGTREDARTAPPHRRNRRRETRSRPFFVKGEAPWPCPAASRPWRYAIPSDRYDRAAV
jgi:hypothetical protein